MGNQYEGYIPLNIQALYEMAIRTDDETIRRAARMAALKDLERQWATLERMKQSRNDIEDTRMSGGLRRTVITPALVLGGTLGLLPAALC